MMVLKNDDLGKRYSLQEGRKLQFMNIFIYAELQDIPAHESYTFV